MQNSSNSNKYTKRTSKYIMCVLFNKCNHLDLLYEKNVPKSFTKFSGNNVSESFFNKFKVYSLQYYWNGTPSAVFSCEFW